MDIERQLLSKCINAGVIDQVVARGIGPQHFGDECRSVFMTVTQHMARYGAPPSRDAVLMAHPGFRFEVAEDTIEFLIDKFVEHVQDREAEKSVIDLANRLRDPKDDTPADILFMEYTQRVAEVVPTSRVSRLSDAPKRIELYREMQRKGRIPGVPTGITSIDAIILGVQGHELVVYTAPSSGGKSTMMQYSCLSAYLNGPEHRPVFISLEMDGDALLRKFDTMATNFEYRALRALELGEGDMAKWEQWGERVSNAPNDIIIIDDINECTVERVFAEVLRWKPSAMFVDYFGIMTPTRSGDQKEHVGMANMAKALKRIPRTTRVPLFTAAQTNRAGFKEGVRADNVADTIEIFRSADIMLGFELNEEKPDELIAKIVKNRDGAKGFCTLHWDPSRQLYYERDRFGKKTAIGTSIAADSEDWQPPTEMQPSASLLDNPFFTQAIGA